ncbi:MAG: tRNA (adenosine(37)-N6)-threonylcarbamoyltransferase complex dimerization subunit type 1 TsaB [Coxiellaceae bacterium]|jgi:tRNA threonylcarbamoyladenosine biosynthesis protein TsaB|nr:tRNA (adenosine(37)-N6)-threonylcarbamoyltransferase complex dimerization subunit type 1 TsaB [Coxiellaceae bacterium]
MLKILAIDTSTDACSSALLFNHKIIDRFMVAPRKHTSFILSMVNDLLSEGEIEFNQLDAIAFGCGPGSFTGVRLATSVAQGFALASNLSVIKISTLRALAQEVFVEFRATKVLVAQDARMQEVYWGEYCVDNNGIMKAIKPDSLINPYKIKTIINSDFVGVGDGFEVYNDFFTKNCKIPFIPKKYIQAKYVARLAANDFVQGLVVTADKVQPTYLREKVAWIYNVR